MLRVIRAAECRAMPWKNGGGETTELAVFPPGASLDDFGWRVSRARVASDGAFSRFDGVDRSLAVLDGAGLVLSIGQAPAVTLAPGSPPLRFAADVATFARLVRDKEAVHDLNVMTRRDRFEHSVAPLQLHGKTTLSGYASSALLVCHRGSVQVQTPQGSAQLGPGDALWVEQPGAVSWDLQAVASHAADDAQGCSLFWVQIRDL
ncbi:HutD/Ves family protein [Polaromonas sp.]|uniref:HutD/Ves family protein n=1 Tax=Polaromonas sp. TaxID=1869339 RepID=UPI002FC9D021